MDNSKIIKELEELGFEKEHINLASSISTNKEEMVEIIIKMIEDPNYMQELKSTLNVADNNQNNYNNAFNANTNLFSNLLGNMEPKENYKMVILVRKDLKMGIGKIAAQVGHAVLKAYKQVLQSENNELETWEITGQAKIVLGVDNLEQLKNLYEKAKKLGLNCCTIKDAGRTQIDPGTMTCCAIGPEKVSLIDSITGSLSLL